jgi:hypothetical protein
MGKGRPRVSPGDDTVRVTIRIPAKLDKLIRLECAKLKMSISEFARLAFDLILRRK